MYTFFRVLSIFLMFLGFCFLSASLVGAANMLRGVTHMPLLNKQIRAKPHGLGRSTESSIPTCIDHHAVGYSPMIACEQAP